MLDNPGNMAQNQPPTTADEAEADFRAWSLIYDSLKFNSSTLQGQLVSFDAKATGLIAAGGVVIGLAVNIASQHLLSSLGAVLLVVTIAVVLVAEGFGLAVVLTGIVQVPYITAANVAEKPGPRDHVARNLTRTFSEAIANSKPSYDSKRRWFASQVVTFTTGTIVLGLLLALLATEPTWIESSGTPGPGHHGPNEHQSRPWAHQ